MSLSYINYFLLFIIFYYFHSTLPYYNFFHTLFIYPFHHFHNSSLLYHQYPYILLSLFTYTIFFLYNALIIKHTLMLISNDFFCSTFILIIYNIAPNSFESTIITSSCTCNDTLHMMTSCFLLYFYHNIQLTYYLLSSIIGTPYHFLTTITKFYIYSIELLTIYTLIALVDIIFITLFIYLSPFIFTLL